MSHYFDETPTVGSDEAIVDVALPDIGFTMVTDRGVFSRGHLDAGTALLLRAAPPPSTTGDLLDLGCGAGPIALSLALRSPGATVWAVDTNERARALTERNCARNGVSNVRVCAPSDVPADVTTVGLVWVHNLDDTNFVEVGRDVTGAFYATHKLLPGMKGWFYAASNLLYLKADTAACLVDVRMQVDFSAGPLARISHPIE